MRIIGQDTMAEAARQALATHRRERQELQERITQALSRDGRLVAAWLFGSIGRGEGDGLSDLDLFVVVADEKFDGVAGFAPAREAFLHQVGGRILLLGEAPQNAPPRGAYVGALYAGEVGPHRIDWYWQPHSAAAGLPADGIHVLFDHIGLPRSETPFVWDYQPIPDETPEESAARDCGAFWSMLLITAKYVARSPQEDGMGLLKWAYAPLNALERFAGVAETPEEGVSPGSGTDPVRKIGLLRRRIGRMESVGPLLAARGVAVPDADMAEQAGRYLDMIEIVASRRLAQESSALS